MVSFQQEKAQDNFEEALPILEEHWKEIAHYQDILLEPDYEAYIALENAGKLRTYVARKEDGEMVGYAVYFLKTAMHYKSSLVAAQDILFISKNHRGMGGRFIKWCDEMLRAEKVQVVSHHIKAAHNFGPMLERFGYELQDLIYTRRLDK